MEPFNAALFGTTYHVPVLYREILADLVVDPAGVYVDGTLGGGGHSASFLTKVGSAGGKIFGIDQDDEALKTASNRLAPAIKAGSFQTLKGNFADMVSLVNDAGVNQVDGILLDLGVSSHQIDTPKRGFSYGADGPLDMRMNLQGTLDAEQLINMMDEAELRLIFFKYGEEKRSSRIARKIIESRPITSTKHLVDVITSCIPSKDENKSLARIFQALRIAVNDEMGVLELALTGALKLLKPAGRLAVISYHSLEDRPTKRFLRAGNFTGKVEKDFYGNPLTPWKLITRKAVKATAEEIAINPRARSARLRIAEKRADFSHEEVS